MSFFDWLTACSDALNYSDRGSRQKHRRRARKQRVWAAPEQNKSLEALEDRRLLTAVPTLDAISDITIDEDASGQTVNLTNVTAGGGESQPLQVTASSSDTSLIPNPTVTYTSPDATGSLAFTPVADFL